MNRKVRTLMSMLAPAFVLSSGAVIFSQQPARGTVEVQPDWTQEPGATTRPSLPREDTFNFISSEMSFDGKVVKNAPYSARAVTEVIQTLADGNRIVNKSTAALFRDSEGRTRREQKLRTIGPFATADDPPQTIFIYDPVGQISYVLDARSKTARKMPSFRFEVSVGGQGEVGKTYERTPAPSGQAEGSGNVYVYTSPPAGSGVRMEYYGGRGAKQTSLGKQTMEGVEVEGTRNTFTIPAGEIGNDLPIEIINERWYSAALQTVVMSRQSDPRFGETVYRLTNVDRSEPDKSLFEIPGDYTVKGLPGALENKVGTGSATIGYSGTVINGGVLNGKTTSMPLPQYPEIARQAHASGAVTVQVTVDEEGNVIEAKAIAGHPLLQAAAVAAARQAKFTPTRLSGQPVKVTGNLIYNFVAQ
ncbi:MAG: TonB family protein [Acidobacteriota bacterium]